MALKQCIGKVMLDMLKAGYTITVCTLPEYNSVHGHFKPEAFDFSDLPRNSLRFKIMYKDNRMQVSRLRSFGEHLEIYLGCYLLHTVSAHEAESLRFAGDLFERFENRHMHFCGMDVATTTLLIELLQECPALKSRVIVHNLDCHSPDFMHTLAQMVQ